MVDGQDMAVRLFQRLKRRFDQQGRVHLLLSSGDPELYDYFEAFGANGSTHMEENGDVFVKIHDTHSVTKGCWLEECAHAVQLLIKGQIELSSESPERAKRGIEVARCLLNRDDRSRLPPEDRDHYMRAINHYGGYNVQR